MNISDDSDEDNDDNKEDSAVHDDEDKVQEDNDEDLHGFSIHDWVFKRLGCGILGDHLSLIFCQIQCMLFDQHFY
jgi:hypothetical protein